MRPFRLFYQPLQSNRSIRLIDLEAGEDKREIRCFLKEWDLDDNPSYAALSYTWGASVSVPYRAAAPSQRVWCNDKPLFVTAILYEALLKLRSFQITVGDSTLLHWIDVICINQEDSAERSSQVAIMSVIYAKASVVNAWLGHEDNNSTTAFQIIVETLLPIIT